MFVSVSYNECLTSEDGLTWSSRTIPAGSYQSVAWGAGAHLFVAVGVGVSAYSSDGITWTAGGNPGSAAGVCWSEELGLFVAVGTNAAGNASQIATSPDGVTWTVRSTAGNKAWKRVVWGAGAGMFVAIAPSGVIGGVQRTGGIAYSSDGITWTVASDADTLQAVAWSETLGLFVKGAADQFGSGAYSSSPDGSTWTYRGTWGGQPNDIVWSDTLSRFIAVGYSTPNEPDKHAATSTDGLTWTLRTLDAGTSKIYASVAAGPSLLVASGDSERATSTDATTWTVRSNWSTGFTKALTYADTNRPPNAPALASPADGATIDRSSTQRFAWTFSDPDVGDSQSAYNLYYRLVGAPSWTTLTASTPNAFRDFAAGAFAAGDYEWQVDTTDAAGEAGPRSTSSFFTAADAPTGPSITAPTNGGTVAQSETVTWSTPAQDSYQLRRVADNAGTADTATVYYDTGEVVSTGTRSQAVAFETNDRYEHVQLRVKSGGLWSSWASVRVLVSYTPPETPVVTVSADAATGSLLVGITNPAPGAGVPATSYNEVYVDDGDGEERRATFLAPNTPWRYWTPIAGRDYATAIRVVAVGDNGTTASSS